MRNRGWFNPQVGLMRRLIASATIAALLVPQQGFFFEAIAAISAARAVSTANSAAAAAAGAAGSHLSRVQLTNFQVSLTGPSLSRGALPSLRVLPSLDAVSNVKAHSKVSIEATADSGIVAALSGSMHHTAGASSAEQMGRRVFENPVTRKAALAAKRLAENESVRSLSTGRRVSRSLARLFSRAKDDSGEAPVPVSDASFAGGSAHKNALTPALEGKPKGKPTFVEVRLEVIKHMKEAFKASMTKPNKQDYTYLATKTFGVNLAIRLFFVVQGVMTGGLGLTRAIASTAWYQLQDAVFTVFGQTYMKFLDKMTGFLRIGKVKVGDFVFIYGQLVAMEFINRLLLGPLGENPLVYTWVGMGLIFANVLMGMISGGPLIPAINKMHRSGAIKHSTMMHLYQISSLALHLGLLASFGFQSLYLVVSIALALVSWGLYLYFSIWGKTPAEPVEIPRKKP